MIIENGILKPDGVIQLRGGLADVLSSVNPLVGRREIMLEIDTGKLKIGDGVRTWNELPYSGGAMTMPPSDDNLYGMKNSDWVQIDASGTEIPVEKSLAVTLSAQHISQKYIELPFAPDTSKAAIVAIQGVLTERGVDWNFNGNKITWNGLELEKIAQAGDKVFIKYYKL